MLIDFEREKRFRNRTYTAADCAGLTPEQIMRKVMSPKLDEIDGGASRTECLRKLLQSNQMFADLILPSK